MKKILVVILILLCMGHAKADTLSELRAKARYRLRDTGNSDTYKHPNAEIDYWLNEAQRKVIKRVMPVESRTHIDTSSTTFPNEYDLPSNFLEIKRAYIINISSTNRTSYERLNQYSISDLDQYSRAWDDADVGTPTDYYIRYTSYSVVIGLYPPPDSSHTGTNFLRVDYVLQMDDLSATSDEAFNGLKYLEPYNDLLVEYAVAMCEKNLEYLQLFEIKLKNLEKDILSNPDDVTIINATRGG